MAASRADAPERADVSARGVASEAGPVVPLRAAADRPVEEVGGKARTLGRLLRAGFPVPDGFVLTATPLTPEVRRRLAAAADRLGDVALAVRSSAAAEDAAHASYAGQYRTELDVKGFDELRAAIRRCRAAASSERVRVYRGVRDARPEADGGRPEADGDGAEGTEGGLPLLVQRMVAAEASGVAFTADPRTGDREAVVVEAVAGAGESLVSGEATPERWRVRCGRRREQEPATHPGDPRAAGAEEAAAPPPPGDLPTPEREDGPERVLDEASARAVGSLALRVEQALGAPQDIEWATAGGEIHLLQARPITTGPERPPLPIPVDPPESGFWFRDEAHFPRPFHPLFASIYVPRYREAVGGAFREFGVLIDGLEIREVGGWPYSRIVPPGGKEGSAPPGWLLWVLARLSPTLRGKMRRARRAREEDLEAAHVRRWWEEWRPALERWVRRKDALDLGAMGRESLRDHFADCVDTFEEGLEIHFRLFPPFFLAVSDLAFFCRDELGWGKGRAAELLAGVSGTSSEPGRALDELARAGAGDEAVRRILEEGGTQAAGRLRAEAPDFARAFREYQDRYGLRTLHYDFATPTFRERPEMVLALVRNRLGETAEDGATGREGRGAGGGVEIGTDVAAGAAEGAAAGVREAGVREADALREERVAEARRSLAGRPEARRRFDALLERAHRAYPVREDNEFLALSVLGLLRYAALEVGRRMAEAGHLEAPERVFFLREGEVRAWLDGPGDLREVAGRRERRHRWALAHPGPPTYGEDPGPPPDPSPLPPAGRRVFRALLWTVENDIQTPPPESEGLAGVGAAPGRYTGPVRVVRSEEEFGKVRSGDVLVCPITSPTWSVVFPSIGALVTDAGGLLSHPAIIAREFGVPAVLATGRATEELGDGEVVTVDGSAGRIERH